MKKKSIVCMTLILILLVTLTSLIPVQATGSNLKSTSYTLKSANKGLLGDVSGNNKISIRDATYIQLYLVNPNTFSSCQKQLADVDQNGKINIRDVTIIQLYLVGHDLNVKINTYIDIEEEPSEETQSTESTTEYGGWLPGYFD